MRAFLTGLTLVAATPLAAAEPVAGSWVTAARDGVVRIGTCGTATCGWLARFLVVPPQGADQVWDLLFQSNLAVAFGKKSIKAQLGAFFDQAAGILSA